MSRYAVFFLRIWHGEFAVLTQYCRVEVIDFYSKRLPDDVIEQARMKAPDKEPKKYRPNKAMMQWIWTYFNDRKDQEFIPPLYFQYDGKFITIDT